ncbi:MAG: glycyl-radical enzyme activating protein [Niameybacter sp.]
MISGTVFDIQRLCVHDGPGIRTTVFLKGCSLQCFWCHNPESLKHHKELMFFSEKCMQCKECIERCPEGVHTLENGEHLLDRTKCKTCGACASHCMTKALSMAGVTMTVEEVMEEVMKDVEFYKTSNGGVTFSGGEALLQIDFLEAVLRACKQNSLHVTIETAGNVKWEHFERILPHVDLFLYDIKMMDSLKHKQYVGADNARCLSNVEQLIKRGKNIIVRVPVIPDINDHDKDIEAITNFVKHINKEIPLELLPFHKMGQTKYESLGLDYEAKHLEAPSQETMQRLNTIIFKK